MKKRLFFLGLLLALLLPCLMISAGAEVVTGTCGENLTWNLDTDTGVLTISGTGAMSDYTLAEAEASPWFGHRGAITTVKIEEGVTSVGNYAFYEHKKLTDAEFPSTLLSVGAGAFQRCKSFRALLLKDGVQSVGADACSSCYALSRVELPESITEIGRHAFMNCDMLTEVDLPEEVKVLTDTFLACDSLKWVDLPDRLITLDGGFYKCAALEMITIPDGVTTIGDSTFEASGLTEIYIPESVTRLGSHVFAECESLKEAFLSRGVTGIPSHAFYFCHNMERLTYTNSVTAVGDHAFYNSGLEEINFIVNKDVVKDPNSGYVGEYNTEYYHAVRNKVEPTLPTGVSIQGDRVLNAGDKVNFYATVYPKIAYNRSVTWSSSDETVAKVDKGGVVTCVGGGTVTITATTCNGLTASQKVTVNGDEVVITVNGYSEEDILADLNYKPEPLADATVVVNGITKTTGADGVVKFAPAELPASGVAKITVSCGDQYEVKEGYIYYNSRKEHTYNLKMLSNQIQFQAVSAVLEGLEKDLLAAQNRKYVNYLNEAGDGVNTQATQLNITVDWGRHKANTADRKVWLSGEKGQQVSMKEGANFVVLTNYFEEQEIISIHASTKDDKSNEISVSRPIPLGLLAMDVEMVAKDTESVSIKDLSYLNNLTTEIKIGDFMKWGGKVAVENGVLTVEFGQTEKSEQREVSLFGGFFEGKAGPEVQVSGRVQIPFTKTGAGTWSGGLFMFMGNSTQMDHVEELPEANTAKKSNKMVELFKNTYNLTISGVPPYVDSTLKAGLEGAVNLGGTFDTVGLNGKLEPQGEFTLGGGIGVGYDVGNDEMAVKFGAEGALNVKLPVTYTMQMVPEFDTLAAFDPEIKGSVSAKMVIKVMDVDLEGKLELGHVKWTKDGATWWDITAGEGELFALGDDAWKIAGRDYLANGGGFIGDANYPELLSRNDGEQTVYENISPNSDGVLTLMDGVPVLLFTVDDTEREAANALKLVYSRYVDGAWTPPVAVADDGTLDTTVDAGGKFVVWENSNTTFGADLTLDTMLNATDIAAAVWNGESYDVTALTAGVGYEFGPKVYPYSGGESALIAWLSNTEADLTGKTGTTSLHYVVYDRYDGWSEVTTVENVGAVTNLEVTDSSHIYYKVGDATYYLYTRSGEIYKSGNTGVGRYDFSKDILAHLDGDRMLHIKSGLSGTVSRDTLQTAYCGSENPVLAYGGAKSYIFWTDEAGLCYTSYANKALGGTCVLDDSDAIFSSVSAAVAEDGSCLVSYYRTADGRTDLVTRTLTAQPELTAQAIAYDGQAYRESGNVRYTLTLVNRGQLTAEGVCVSFYEGEDLVYTEEFFGSVPSGGTREYTAVFSPEDSTIAHDYRVVVSAEGDSSEEDNGLELHVGGVDLSLAQAWFGRDDLGAGQLTVLVENLGDLDVESAQVKVCKNNPDSAPVAELDTGLVRSGSVVQLTLPQEQDKEAVYYVTLSAEGDSVAYNDVTLLAYDNVENLNAELSASQEGTTVTAIVRPNDLQIKEAALIWAVYDSNGKLKETAVETVDLSVGAQAVGKELPTLAAEDRVAVMLADPAQGLKPLGLKTVFTAE